MLPRLAASLAALALSAGPAWAQVEGVAKGVDLAAHAASNIADQGGLLGSIAVVAGVLSVLLHIAQGLAIVSLYKANQALQEKRALEATESTKQVASTAISGANAITASNESLAALAARTQTLAERLLPIPEAVADIKARMGEISRSCGRGPA